MFRLPLLEYNLSHPHPRNRIFLFTTFLLFLLILPILILVNLVTLGLELVPSLQPASELNDTFLENWWGTRHLPALLRPKPPPCQPRDIGRGDTFRLSTSLFDYTVMGAWDTSKGNETFGVQEQQRFEYRDQPFSRCSVNRAGYTYKSADLTHSVFIGIVCPGSKDYPIFVSLKTQMTFSVQPSQDFIEQYYGPGLNPLRNRKSSDYRKAVLAAIELISSDAIAIMRKPMAAVPSFNFMTELGKDSNGTWQIVAGDLLYSNGTQPSWVLQEITNYVPSMANLLMVALDAVNLDLGNRHSNIFTNATRLAHSILPNLAPAGIDPTDWAVGATSRNYGNVAASYQTWAHMLLHGLPINISSATGMPKKSVMVTNYLCPVYQIKRTGSLLASIFVGTATMTLSAWGAWMFFTTIVAKRIEEPQVPCFCTDCKKREAEEQEREKGEAATPVRAGLLAAPMSLLGVTRRTKPGHHPIDEETGKSECETPQPEHLAYMSYTKHTSELGGIATE